ncbi:MAG TPA: hypothetical protein VIA18_21010, partial [Polyangia bacterium]|nr:hypothetical protein [Polyangia bacterium]
MALALKHEGTSLARADAFNGGRMDTRFEALGAYLPSTKVSTRDLVSQMKFEPLFDLQEITGIETRRVHDKSAAAFEDS